MASVADYGAMLAGGNAHRLRDLIFVQLVNNVPDPL